MKTLEKIKVLSFEEKEKLEKEILKAISDNNLTKVKDILKYCPAEISCYGKNTVKYNEQETNDGSIIIGSPFLDPYSLILKAALTCGNNGNDFSILHYLFDEYGLSLKEPVSNFPFYEINRIIKADENIIIAKEGTEILLYSYLKEDNPSIEVIKFLVSKGARFDIYNDKYGNTILHNYVENNAYKRLEIAIKGGADVNMKAIGPWYDDTLLSYATSRSNDMYKTAKLLIELGADVNYLITPKHTILDLAYNSKNEKLLIDFGALTYQQLCEKNNIEFTKMSIEDLKCIAIHTRDSLAKKLNDIVKENNLEGVKEFLKDYPVPEVFFEKCFNVVWDDRELGPFFNPTVTLGCAGLAYDKDKDFVMIEYLESLGLKADYEYLGDNALTRYINQKGKNPKMIEYFLSKGAKFEIYNKYGDTPLHTWAGWNEAKALETALKAGANINIKRIKTDNKFRVGWDWIGATPLYEAASSDRHEPVGACTAVLLKYGAEVNAVHYRLKDDGTTWSAIFSVLDETYDSKNKQLLKEAGAKTWKQLVKEYNIDTSLELKEQYRIYNELLEKKSEERM